MTISEMLIELEADLNMRLDLLHDELLKRLRRMGRITGQRTRSDRL